jgi:hypothetical protein
VSIEVSAGTTVGLKVPEWDEQVAINKRSIHKGFFTPTEDIIRVKQPKFHGTTANYWSK